MEISPETVKFIQSLTPPTIIAVSGFGGSGKSTISKNLSELLGKVPVVCVDSFFIDNTSTVYLLWDIMDFDRLTNEVLVPFSTRKEMISYGHYDWGINSIKHCIDIPNGNYLIVEGVGLFRPELLKFFNYKIWIDCPIDKALERGKQRDKEMYDDSQEEKWDGIWKENDLQCFDTYKLKELADLVVNNL